MLLNKPHGQTGIEGNGKNAYQHMGMTADGISVRFMNSNQAANNLRTPDEIKEFVAKVWQGNRAAKSHSLVLCSARFCRVN